MSRALLALLVFVPDGLTPEEFSRLHKELDPPSGEVWRTIP